MVAAASSPQRFARLAGLLSDWKHARAVAPLACVRAWHQDEPGRTSQRNVIQQVPKKKTIIVAGGNRTGKTTLARWILLALVLGSDHPIAAAFWRHHGVDPSSLPRGPAEGAIVALSHEGSVKLHRRQLCDLLPKGSYKLVNAESKGEAHVHITVPGYDRPATIWFMAEGQKMEAFQGTSWRAVLHDEEGPDAKVWDEAGIRVADQDGWQILANTPLNGRTWVWHRFVKVTPPGCAYLELHTRDNPFLPRSILARFERTDKAKARLYGAWEVATGLVYPSFSREMHVLTPERWEALYPGIRFGRPPPDWLRYRSMDFGSTNPCVVLWAALDPHGRLVCYRLAYRRGQTMKWWASLHHRAEGRSTEGPDAWTGEGAAEPETIDLGWADPAGAQEIRDLIGFDVGYAFAQKALGPGIGKVKEDLEPQADGWPALLIVDGACPELVVEAESYVWADPDGGSEKPVKKDDHALDCLRYLVVGVRG